MSEYGKKIKEKGGTYPAKFYKKSFSAFPSSVLIDYPSRALDG